MKSLLLALVGWLFVSLAPGVAVNQGALIFGHPMSQRTSDVPKLELNLSQIEAKSALAIDLARNEILFEKNPKEILPLASLTKIISILTLMDLLSLDEEIAISQAAVLAPEPSRLNVGEMWRVRELVIMALVESSNDATYALFEHASKKHLIEGGDAEAWKAWFLGLIHKKARESSAASMRFYNITGLDISENEAGSYGSAEDVLQIVKATLNHQIWQLSNVTEIISPRGETIALKPTNALFGELPSIIGSKTGFTDLAGGNLLVIIEYPLGRPLGIVVLGSSEQGRFSDVQKILDWVKARSPIPTLPL